MVGAASLPQHHMLKITKTYFFVVRVVILISGHGSNMEAIIRNASSYEVETVISNKPEAYGLQTAAKYGIKCVIEPSLEGIGRILDDKKPDLVCMAGFMRIMPGPLTERHTIMNIHPSLLPKYPGLYAIPQALKAGARYSGCTVHFADSGVDTGAIIAQSVVPILPGDTKDTLTERIHREEHILYPRVVAWYANSFA